MQDETALYGAKMMQPGMTAADSEETTSARSIWKTISGRKRSSRT